MSEALGWCLCICMAALVACMIELKIEIGVFRKQVNNTLKTLGLVVVEKAKEDARKMEESQ